MVQGTSDPVKVFDRAPNLEGTQIISYAVSPDNQWCMVAGIKASAAGGAAEGCMQLYSVEKKVSQPLSSHAGCFHAALRRAIDASGHPALFVVDVVASLGAVNFEMDAWGVNAVIGASQKGLMTPPGIGFCAADEKAMAVCEKNPAPRFYWDWRLRKSEFSYRKFCGTPPQNLLMGMQAAFGLIEKEGIDNVIARHRLLAGAVQTAVAA